MRTAIFQNVAEAIRAARPFQGHLRHRGEFNGDPGYLSRVENAEPFLEEEEALEKIRYAISRDIRDSDRSVRVRVLGDFGSPRMLEVSCGNLSTGFSRRKTERVCGDTRRVIVLCQWAYSAMVTPAEIMAITAGSIALVDTFRARGIYAEAWSVAYSPETYLTGDLARLQACKLSDPSREVLSRDLAAVANVAWTRQVGHGLYHAGGSDIRQGFGPAGRLQNLSLDHLYEARIAERGDIIILPPSGNSMDLMKPENVCKWIEEEVSRVCCEGL